ncbi:MAG: hypothetical protein J6X67_11035 [Treponema sp.]|nr:hypothetical protein [Treponema sp.]
MNDTEFQESKKKITKLLEATKEYLEKKYPDPTKRPKKVQEELEKIKKFLGIQ